MQSFILWSVVVLQLSAATPLRSRYAVKETHHVPRGFTCEGHAPADYPLRLQVGLKQGNFGELERQLYEISDPDHHRYGQHLNSEEINELVKPEENSLATVREWLHQHVSPESIEYTPANDFMSFTVPVAKAEELLDTKYSVYLHTDGSRLVRTTEWKLPLHLHDHIVAVQPTTSFLRSVPQSNLVMSTPVEDVHLPVYGSLKNPTVDEVCETLHVTPYCLATLYETVNYKPKVPGKNQVALCDYLGEINNRSDASIYLEKYRPEAVSSAETFKQISVNGGTLQQTPENKTQLEDGTGIEGDLDVETILGLTYPTPLTAYSTGGAPPSLPDFAYPIGDNEPYLTWLHYILKQSDIPQVISNSYEDNEDTVPPSYAHVVCNHFAQLTARGVSIFFGSGDGGVAGVQAPGVCKSETTKKRAFIPLFPSSCPFITSVGATYRFHPEVVAYDVTNGFSSGGGFSNYFEQPSYQKEAVATYLDKIGDEYSGLYNRSGRAYPDLATQGVNYTIVWDGQTLNIDGTSAATPTAASVFSLLNDALLSRGRPPMGFLNPWLYKKGYSAFFDVTEGSTLGCNTKGFQATAGWDAASGWGTPRFEKLLKTVGLDDCIPAK